MDVHHIAYLCAIATGLVSSGAIGSLWAITSGEAPEFRSLPDDDILTPFRIPAIIFSGPTTLLMIAVRKILENPPLGLITLLTGIIWSFFQGVFILTQIFGVT